jgi:hypothetical protein
LSHRQGEVARKVVNSPVAADVQANRDLVAFDPVVAAGLVPALAGVTQVPDEFKLREESQGAADVAAFTLRQQMDLETLFAWDPSRVRTDRHRSAVLWYDRDWDKIDNRSSGTQIRDEALCLALEHLDQIHPSAVAKPLRIASDCSVI